MLLYDVRKFMWMISPHRPTQPLPPHAEISRQMPMESCDAAPGPMFGTRRTSDGIRQIKEICRVVLPECRRRCCLSLQRQSLTGRSQLLVAVPRQAGGGRCGAAACPEMQPVCAHSGSMCKQRGADGTSAGGEDCQDCCTLNI